MEKPTLFSFGNGMSPSPKSAMFSSSNWSSVPFQTNRSANFEASIESTEPMSHPEKHISFIHSKSRDSEQLFALDPGFKPGGESYESKEKNLFKREASDESFHFDQLSDSGSDPYAKPFDRSRSFTANHIGNERSSFDERRGVGKKVNGRFVVFKKQKNGPLQRRTSIESVQMISNQEWGTLQKHLSDEYNLIHHENRVRKELLEQIQAKYEVFYMKLMEIKAIEKKLQCVREAKGFKSIGTKWMRFLIKDASLLEDAHPLVHEFLYILQGNPEILAKIFTKKNNQISPELVDTIIQGFFENIVENEAFETDLLKFVILILQTEVNKCERFDDIYKSGPISMVIKAFVNRHSCKQFVRKVIEPVCLKIIRLSEQIELNAKKIKATLDEKQQKLVLMRKQKTPSKSLVFSSSPVKRVSIAEKHHQHSKNEEDDPKYLDMLRRFVYKKATAVNSRRKEGQEQSNSKADLAQIMEKVAETISKEHQEERELGSERLGRKLENRGSLLNLSESWASPTRNATSLSNENREATSFHLMVSEENIKINSELENILNGNIEKIKKYCSMFLDSFFERVDQTPMSIRVLWKVFLGIISERFPGLDNPLDLMMTFLLEIWLHPIFIDPIGHNIVKSDEYELNESKKTSIRTLGLFLTRISKGEIYNINNESFLAAKLNEYILDQHFNLRVIMEQIIEVDDETFMKIKNPKDLALGDQVCDLNQPKMKSQCICLSLENVKQLLCHIRKIEGEIKDHPRLLELVNSIWAIYKDEDGLFSTPRIKSVVGEPQQSFLLFTQTKFDQSLEIDYESEFAKLQSTSVCSSSDESAITSKLKTIFKLVLISIDDISKLMIMTKRDQPPSLLDLIETQFRVHRGTEQNIRFSFYQKEKVNLQLALLYLKKNLGSLSEAYSENNFRLIYQFLLNEYSERTQHMASVIHEAKSSLLNGLQVLKTNISSLDGSLVQLRKLEKHLVITRFVKEHETQFCMTTEAERKELSRYFSLMEPAKIGKGIQLIYVDEGHTEKCIHEQIELYLKINNGFGGGARTSSFTGQTLPFKDQHIRKISDFIERFSSFSQLKDCIQLGRDFSHEKETYEIYFENMLFEFEKWIKDNLGVCFEKLKEEETNEYIYILEKYMTRQIYERVFPKNPTLRDLATCARLKVLDWVLYDDLVDKPKKGFEQRGLGYMLELAATKMLEMDDVVSPREKLEKAVQMSNYAAGAYAIIENKNVSADETLPLTIKVFLKAKPMRMVSNLNFINIFFRQGNSSLGYENTQLIGASQFLNSIRPGDLKMTHVQFESKIYERERKEQVYFFRRRARGCTRFISDVTC